MFTCVLCLMFKKYTFLFLSIIYITYKYLIYKFLGFKMKHACVFIN